jgi:hypothetical protein
VDLFDRFFLFLQSARVALGIEDNELSALTDLLTLDFHLIQRGGAGPSWLRTEERNLRERLLAVLALRDGEKRKETPEIKDGLGIDPMAIPQTDWKRRVKFFTFGVDPGSGVEEETIVLVHTPVVGGSSWYKLPAGFMLAEES